MPSLPRCEADTYAGGVCHGTLTRQWSTGPLVCRYGQSHLTDPAGERLVHRIGSSPSSPWYTIGRAVLTAPTDYHEMSQYPGADRMLTAQPQTVILTSNGYYCAYRVTGTITGRGYYGGEIGVEESYTSQPYAYDVVAALIANGGVSRGGTVRYELMPGVEHGFVLEAAVENVRKYAVRS